MSLPDEVKNPCFKGGLNEKKTFNIAEYSAYEIDFVFCIENSENMRNHLERVKKTIPKIIENVSKCGPLSARGIRQLRARLITFGDYRVHKRAAIFVTDFFDLSNEKEKFISTLDSIEIQPGNVQSVCGLEALKYAEYSEWSNHWKNRRYIWVFSASETNTINDSEIVQYHAKGMPDNLKDYVRTWDFSNRIFAFLMTPYKKNWDMVTDYLPNCLCFSSLAGEGITEAEFESFFGSLALGFD